MAAKNTPTPPAPGSDYNAEAFFSIEAPDEHAARRVLKDTVAAIDVLIESRRAEAKAAGVEISLCMESDNDPYAVEEL